MIETINNILNKAINNEAQDITFFPHGEDYEVAFRTADVKQVHDFISSEDADALFSHIKSIADMDVTKNRCSQVRTCDYQLDDGRVITIRISTIVNFQGLETMSIRLIHVSLIVVVWKKCLNKYAFQAYMSLLVLQVSAKRL